MKKAKLVQAMFTQEEIAAINTKNIKLEEENEMLKKELWILDCKGWTPELVWHAEFLRYLIEENKKLKEENNRLNELLSNVTRCAEEYRGKMISIVEEMKNFLYKD